MKIGNKLKALRKIYGKKQKEIAEYLGIAINTYSQYENNSRQPSYHILSKISNYFNASYDFLLEEYDSSLDQADYELDSKEHIRDILIDNLIMTLRNSISLMNMIDDVREKKPKDVDKEKYLLEGLEKEYSKYLKNLEDYNSNFDLTNMQDRFKNYLNIT